MYLEVTEIYWDTDGEHIEDLPKEVTVNLKELGTDDINEAEDMVVDYLSDKYGYCIFGCSIN